MPERGDEAALRPDAALVSLLGASCPLRRHMGATGTLTVLCTWLGLGFGLGLG